MRYGVKPSSRAYKSEQTLRKIIQDLPTIKKWVEIAYPFFMVEADCMEEKTEEITRLEYFILRAIHEAKAQTLPSITMLLGLDQKYLQKVVDFLITVDHLVENTSNGFMLTASGMKSLETNQKQKTKKVPRCILLDGISKKPLPIDFYRPMNHHFSRVSNMDSHIGRIVPKSVEPSDLAYISRDLSREDKVKVGLPADLVHIETEAFGFEIVYHLFHVGLLDNQSIVVYDSCSGEQRKEFTSLDYSLLKEIYPHLEEQVEPKKLQELLAQSFKFKARNENIAADQMGRYQLYCSAEEFTSNGWDYIILSNPNILKYDGSIITIYPNDEATLQMVLLRYVIRRLKVAIGAGRVEDFDLEATVDTGYKEITAGSKRKLNKPQIGFKELRDFALEKQENLVVNAVSDLLREDEEDVYTDLF